MSFFLGYFTIARSAPTCPSLGYFFVPVKSMCSRKCARPGRSFPLPDTAETSARAITKQGEPTTKMALVVEGGEVYYETLVLFIGQLFWTVGYDLLVTACVPT